MGWLTLLKAVPGFLHTWRLYIMGALILTAGITAFNYIDNHGEMKAQLVAGKETIQGQALDIKALRLEIAKRDERLAAQRALRLAELEEAQLRLQEANDLIDELREEQSDLRQELEVTRFETLEAIRDDEDFSDWVDGIVPPVAWSLLRDAAEGGSDD